MSQWRFLSVGRRGRTMVQLAPEAAAFRTVEHDVLSPVRMSGVQRQFGFVAGIEDLQAAEYKAAVQQNRRLVVPADVRGNRVDISSVRIHHDQSGTGIAVVFVANA